MKIANTQVLDLSVLPEQARQEIADFYQFLKKKYRRPTTATGKRRDAAVQSLAGIDFVGMWKDRTDMNGIAAQKMR